MLYEKIHIVDDTQDALANLIVENGYIQQVDILEDVPTQEQPVWLPAFTDLHAHFRDPGFTYKEDLLSGSRAAVRGGYTAVSLMPNTLPVCSSLTQVREVEARAEAIGLVRVNQILSMTRNEEGEDCSHLLDVPAGAIPFVSDDGKGVNRPEVMEEIFRICKEKDLLIMAHEEDARYSPTDLRMAENAMTFRDLALCEQTGGSIHFCHVSTKEAIQAIADAKRRGLKVSCEVTPHHIFFNEKQANYYRVAPPFRTDEDIAALIQALQDGTADAIATDHAPHTAEDKAHGANGISGIETAFSLSYTKMVRGGFLSHNRLVRLMSTTPSAMMRIRKGAFKVGMLADFAVVDLHNPYTIRSVDFASRGKNTPFEGCEVYGRVLQTIKNGEIVYPR